MSQTFRYLCPRCGIHREIAYPAPWEPYTGGQPDAQTCYGESLLGKGHDPTEMWPYRYLPMPAGSVASVM